MDDLEFSFKDSLQACLACLRPSHSQTRAGDDVLEGLLRDPGSDTDAMSLHSALGQNNNRGTKRRAKQMSLFGWYIFGRPKQPIHLPLEDEEDRIPSVPRRPRNIFNTTSNSESDARPLEDPTSLLSRLEARESFIAAEDARLKSERKQLRRERKGLERAMRDFEVLREQQQEIYDLQKHNGEIKQQQPKPKLDLGRIMRSIGFGDDGDEDGEDGADFGGASYSRKATLSGTRSNGSHSRSDSHSRHSASYYTGPPPAHMIPPPRSDLDLRSSVLSDGGIAQSSQSSTRRVAKSSTASNRSSSSAQSGSLASPLTPHPHNPRVASPLGAHEDYRNEFNGIQNENWRSTGHAFPISKIGGGDGQRE